MSVRRILLTFSSALLLALPLFVLPVADASAAPLTPVDQLPIPPKGLQDPTQCHSFGRDRAGQQRAQGQLDTVRFRVRAALINEPLASAMFAKYLTPGRMSGIRLSVTGRKTLQEFTQAPATQAAYTQVQHDAVRHLSTLVQTSPTPPTSGTLKTLGVGQNLVINWTPATGSGPLTAPALIAGSGGGRDPMHPSLISQLGNFFDTRDMAGNFTVKLDTDPLGTVKKATLQLRGVSLHIEDSIDFCPGGLGGTFGKILTLPMSRLERTPYLLGPQKDPMLVGGFAQPVLWKADVPLPNVDLDVTSLFPPKDPYPTAIQANLTVIHSQVPYNTSGTVTIGASRLIKCGTSGPSCEYSLTGASATVHYQDPNNDHCQGDATAPPWQNGDGGLTLLFSNIPTDPNAFRYITFAFDGEVFFRTLRCDHGSSFAIAPIGGTAISPPPPWTPGQKSLRIPLDDSKGSSGSVELTFTY